MRTWPTDLTYWLTTVHRVFQKWLEIMFAKLYFLIAWRKSEVTHQNMPPAFKSPNVAVLLIVLKYSLILLSAMLPVLKPTRIIRNTMQSSYNSLWIHLLCFCCWGGCVSDKNFTQEWLLQLSRAWGCCIGRLWLYDSWRHHSPWCQIRDTSIYQR